MFALGSLPQEANAINHRHYVVGGNWKSNGNT